MHEQMTVRASRHVYATLTPEGGLLLDTRGHGQWHALTPAAATAWPHLARGDLDAATRALTDRWRIPHRRAHADVAELTHNLLAARLLIRSEPQRRRRVRWLPSA